jgi:archaellin
MSQAVDFSVTYLKDKGLDVGNFTVQRASNVKQAVDSAVDSRRMQQRLDPQVRDIDVTIDQDAGQYEIVDRRTNRTVLQYSADSAADAGDKFNNWLRNQGMPEDTENYGYRPMVSVNESIDGAEKARRALDAAARKLGYADFSQARPGDLNTIRQMARYAPEVDDKHYNMLNKKNKNAGK